MTRTAVEEVVGSWIVEEVVEACLVVEEVLGSWAVEVEVDRTCLTDVEEVVDPLARADVVVEEMVGERIVVDGVVEEEEAGATVVVVEEEVMEEEVVASWVVVKVAVAMGSWAVVELAGARLVVEDVVAFCVPVVEEVGAFEVIE